MGTKLLASLVMLVLVITLAVTLIQMWAEVSAQYADHQVLIERDLVHVYESWKTNTKD